MDGVPRLPMLRSALKTSPEKCDFNRKIKWQIREHFNEDPNSYMNEIRELESLRASACHPPQDFSGCALLKKYYSQLHFLQNRFNFEENGRDEVFFTWIDLYTDMVYSTNDIKHEVACILFNIGALHTSLGAMDNRQTPDGMKMSCSHFQCAAWAFRHLNDNFPQSRDTDLCHEVVHFLETVSLAQAQECILEKSIFDGRKPGIVAKVSAQIVDFYKSAWKVLEHGDVHEDRNPVAEVTGMKTYKSWKKYTEFKMAFHQCLSLLYMGIHSEELQKMGDRLAYFQSAMDKLNEVTKMAKKMDNKMEAEMNDAVSFTHDVVGGKLKAAEKENEFVYHEKVPDKSSLPDIKGASLVKGTPFDINDPEVSGQDIFHRLVPMEAHEASSLYSEEKAKILRRIGAGIEEKDQELALFLTSLQVDQLRVHLEPQSLPQELIDCCAAFSVEGNIVENLVGAMGKLSSVYTEVESTLLEIKETLSREQDVEKVFQSSQGKRPPSMILKELSLEASRFTDAHAKASESNMLLHKAINSHLANLRTLGRPLPEIQAQLPSLQVLESSKDQACIKELQRLLDKVEEMRKQRIMLYSQLREAIQTDDITKLATRQTDLQILFPQELAKHDRLTSLIGHNLSAQEKILVALTEANARYADTRRSTNDIQNRRAATVSALLASAQAYAELLTKSEKGLEFYRKLETNINKLLQRLRSVCLVQQEEREQQEAAQSRPVRNDLHDILPSVPNVGESDAEGPKLKDFLHLMKKDRSGDAMLPPLAPAAGLDGTYSYPYHRPTPLGAEHSEKQAPFASMDSSSFHFYNPSLNPSFNPSHNPVSTASNNTGSDGGYPPRAGGYSSNSCSAAVNSSVASNPSIPSNPSYNPAYSYGYPSMASQVHSFNLSYSSAPTESYGYSSVQQPYQTAMQQSYQAPAPSAEPIQDKSGFGPTASQYPYQYNLYNQYPTTTSPQVYNNAASYPCKNAYSDPAATFSSRAGSYQHGTTGTVNTAPVDGKSSSSNPASYQTGFTARYENGVYQPYPYYPHPQVAGSYYSYPYPCYAATNAADAPVAPQVLEPAPAACSPALTTNLELLSLLDQSVPTANAAVLVPSCEESLTNNTNKTNSTNTLTMAKSQTPAEANSSRLKNASISSPFASPAPPAVAFPGPLSEPAGPPCPPVKDLLTDAESAAKLALEVEKFDKLVEGLTRKSLNGPTSLDVKWKEVQDLLEKESSKWSISVARCYPMKNRLPDVLPYDHNRIELPTTKDDYINASKISLGASMVGPSYIVTQCPLGCTQQDFWTMVWQQQVEILVCLLSDSEMKNSMYWPVDKTKDVECGPFIVSFQSTNVHSCYNEKIFGLSKQGETKQRVLVHLQFTTWPGNSFPASPDQFLEFANETLHFWKHQRNTNHPVLVHCLAGAGRSGLFTLICTALSELMSGQGLVDVVKVTAALCQQRRNMFRDREHLLFAYQALLYYAQQLLIKRGILSGRSSLHGSPAKFNKQLSKDETQRVAESFLADGNETCDNSLSLNEDTDEKIQVEEAAAGAKKKENVDAILDPANFSMDSFHAKARVTKESFTNKNTPQLGVVKDPSDPLNQLDPLWSLAK